MAKKTKTESIIDVIESVEASGFSQEQYIMKLEKDNTSLGESLSKASEKLIELQQEIVNLKAMLFQQNSNITGIVAPMSDEELIADLQLRILAERAKKGELNLEEIKRYDLLVKNKKLAREKEEPQKPRDVTKSMDISKLLEVAAHKKTEER